MAHSNHMARKRSLDPELLSAVIDYLPLPIFMKDENSAFVLSNLRHQEMIGRPEHELLGHTTAILISEEDAEQSRMRDLPVLERGEESIVQRDTFFKDGHKTFVETRKARLFDSEGKPYVVGLSIDMSEVRQRESHLRSITASVPVGLVEVTEGKGVTYANDLALNYLHLKDHDEPLKVLLAQLSQGRETFPGEKQKFELTIGVSQENCKRLLVRTSGWIEIPYKAERSAVISLTDLSEVAELRRENNEINRLNLELEAKLKELRDLQDEMVKRGRMEQLGQLTATIAHELRNPLGAVRTSAFLLQRKLQDKNPGTEVQFGRVANGIQRCDDIITQLLDFARVRQLDLKEVSLDEWLAEVVEEECRSLSNALNVFCDLNLGNLKVAMDAARMSRAVINLVHNASEAMLGKAGQPVAGSTDTPTVSVTSRMTERGCEIEVRDNGPGMTPDILKKIREPLFTTKNFGTGLGISAVEKILEQHHGGLDIHSEPGKGATFTLWWPAQSQEQAA